MDPKIARFQKIQLRRFFNTLVQIQNNLDQFWSHFSSISGSGDTFVSTVTQKLNVEKIYALFLRTPHSVHSMVQ